MLRAGALVLVLAALAGALVGETHSRFSAQAASIGNALHAAASFCTAVTETATASADAYVDGELLAQGANFGGASHLDVRAEVAANRRTLVRFDLPPLPDHCSVTAAALRLYATSAAAGRTLEALRAAAVWNESGVTWNDQPGVTGTAATVSSGPGWQEWSVTAHVQAMYAGADYGFVVRDSSEEALLAAAQRFSSREGSDPPQLVVTFG